MDIEQIKLGMKVIPIKKPLRWQWPFPLHLEKRKYVYVCSIDKANTYYGIFPPERNEQIIVICKQTMGGRGKGYYLPEHLIDYNDRNERNFYGQGTLTEPQS